MIVNGLVAFVALQHLGFLVLEMFLWKSPIGLKIFANTPAKAETTAVLAANQGLYNGFLAAGLITSFFLSPSESHTFRVFFLSCIIIAGIYGAWSVSPRILFIQAVPAILALLALRLTL